MSSDTTIPDRTPSSELEELVKLRREFHSYPETMWTEFWTTVKIVEFLENLGCEVRYGRDLYPEGERVDMPSPLEMDEAYQKARKRLGSSAILDKLKGGYTGALVHIKCGKPGPKIGFRVDIDGLPIVESKDEDHFPAVEGFASKNGKMHACGHDGHITIGLGLVKKLVENSESLSGDLYVFFQPSEEGGMGGEVFSRLDVTKDLDYFIATHLGLMGERKIICATDFLALKKMGAVFQGRSSHAACSPERGRNALQAACVAVNNLYSIPRNTDGMSRVNVGEFHSNNAHNVISDRTEFKFEVRGETNEVMEYMLEHAKSVLEASASMHGLEVELEDLGGAITAPNSPALAQKIEEAAMSAGVPKDAITNRYNSMGSEDAPYMMRVVQEQGGEACYMGIGSHTRGGHHNPLFDFDEDLILWGVDILYEIAKSLR